MCATASRSKTLQQMGFNAQSFLDSGGVSRKIVEYPQNAVVFAQGDPAEAVMYIQQGRVKLTVVNGVGKEAVVAVLGPGDFFGEGCLAGSTRSHRSRDGQRANYGACY